MLTSFDDNYFKDFKDNFRDDSGSIWFIFLISTLTIAIIMMNLFIALL